MSERIRIFVGHFGSGKSELAINEALATSDRDLRPTLVDLDVVKPYFRCRLLRDTLADRGVQLIAPEGDRFYADLPIILPEIKGAIQDPARFVYLDSGGDDTGARVLGSFSEVLHESGYEMSLVVNTRRPFTGGSDSLAQMVEKIRGAARLSITDIISNTHIMDDTTPEVVGGGYREAERLSKQLGVPLRYVAAEGRLAETLDPGDFACPIRPIERYILPPFARTPEGRRPITGVI
jgi:hypothetical protein